MKIISEDDWIAQYKPLPAPRPDAGYDFGSGSTLIDHVRNEDRQLVETAHAENRLWTVISGDGDAISSGMHFVNKMGYIITAVAAPDEGMEVEMEDLYEDEEQEEDA